MIYFSSAWTGMTYRDWGDLRYNVRRYSWWIKPLFWWLRVGIRKTLCLHETDFLVDRCIHCGLTSKDLHNHRWRQFPMVYRQFITDPVKWPY